MSQSSAKAALAAREAEALAARERFIGSLQTLKDRLHPKTIAADVKEKAKEKADGAINAAKDGVVQAATHPSTVAAITIPIAVYLFRKPLGRALNAVLKRGEDPELPVEPFEAVREPPAPKPEPEPLSASPKAAATQGVS